jgi:hypothetical protein
MTTTRPPRRAAPQSPLLASAAACALAFVCTTRDATAAAPYVDRHITLPYHDWAFDLGLGVAHYGSDAPNGSLTGPGLNFEVGVGITDKIELALRTGARFNDDARALGADAYGRLFDRQTFEIGGESFANPEARLRGAVYRGDVTEVALEGRLMLPFARGTHVGAMFGVPLMFHIGDSVRLDTGPYVPFVFGDPTYYALSVPLDVWIQASQKLWLGPMTGVRFNRFGDGPRSSNDVQLGFGLGYQLASAIDFKTQFLFPHINGDNGARLFGVGAGFQFRIE